MVIIVVVFLLLVVASGHSLFVRFRAAVLRPAVYLSLCHELVILCFSRLRLDRWSLLTEALASQAHLKLAGLGRQILFDEVHLLFRYYLRIIAYVEFEVPVLVNLIILFALARLRTAGTFRVILDVALFDFCVDGRYLEYIAFFEGVCALDVAVGHVGGPDECLDLPLADMVLKWIIADDPFVNRNWYLLYVLLLGALARR